MNARENLLSLYRKSGYKYAPVTFSLCPSLQEEYRRRAGDTPMPEYFDYPEGFAAEGIPGPKVIRSHVDWNRYYAGGVKEGTSFDIWGVAHEPGSADAKHMTRMRHPLASATSLEEIQAYPYPSFDTSNMAAMKAAVESVHEAGKAAIGHMACTIWETAWAIRSMPQLMMDMMLEDPKAIFLLDKITELSCIRARAYAEAGVDIIHLGDDIGMQQAIMMSVEMYRTWLKPRLKRVIDAAKSVKPDVLIFYHSCGFVKPLIDDLIEAGVEILNPVQPECMDFAEIHAMYSDRLSFNGTLGTQTTMPFGTPDEVRETVFRNLETAGERGGLVCCPTHLLEPEVPWENIEAYVNACKEFSLAGS
ncbi:MAG: hypothetical protein D6820_03100 [Lentisphaerae bacterium]|nr:MAG: hypothetical protein D6820_03100 [Lentisphaerota bacterium]